MGQRGLLSRLGTGQRQVDTVESVIEHLRVLLNTCSGESVTVPDFGLMDFSDIVHELPHGIHKIQQSIRAVILKYEPRLKNVQVRAIEGDEDESQLFLYFEISAQLVYPNGDRQPVRFNTAVDESTNVKIS